MKKGWLVIVLFAFSCQIWAAGFTKTYKSAPLYEVLQDLETHFSLQFLYRPQDVAAAPPVTVRIKTDDYQTALRQILSPTLQFTIRKDIIIITPVPKKKEAAPASTPKPEKIPAPQPAPQKPSKSPLQAQPKPIVKLPDPFPPVAILTPNTSLAFSPIDTIRISQLRLYAASPAKPTPKKVVKRYKPKFNRPMTHTFMAGLNLDYVGSHMTTQIDLRYGYFFHRNWGISTGIDFYFLASYSNNGATIRNKWIQCGYVVLPFAVRTRWEFTPKWGLQGALGAGPSFLMFTNSPGSEISEREVDVISLAEVDASYAFTRNLTLLFGLSAHLSAISAKPWNLGLHVGFVVGK